jgi:GT2 family glycosyltransferase
MTTVSWIILTHNRPEIVRKALEHNAGNAGDDWDELVWVDNGSSLQNLVSMQNSLFDYADIQVQNRENMGVARGYNQGLGLATKDYVLITGCDMLMPNNWLRTFKDYVEKIPETGVACIYSSHWTEKPERIRQFGIDESRGLPIVHAMPIERRIFKRSLLADFGYFPETFGLYGYDDLAWAYTAERVCMEKCLISYVIPGFVAQHLGTEGFANYDGKDDHAYHEMKRKEVMDPEKRAELARLRGLRWPRFSPFF